MRFSFAIILSLILLATSCAPKDPVVFKGVKNIRINADAKDGPQLDADVFFYNPNKVKSKLKEISVDILVDGKKAGHVKQELKLPIPAESDFSVPVEAHLSFKEIGLLDAVLRIFGAKIRSHLHRLFENLCSWSNREGAGGAKAGTQVEPLAVNC